MNKIPRGGGAAPRPLGILYILVYLCISWIYLDICLVYFEYVLVCSSMGISGKHGEVQPRSVSNVFRHGEVQPRSVCALFIKFVHFVETQFDWCGEAVSICAGRRAPPSVGTPLHTIASASLHWVWLVQPINGYVNVVCGLTC